jgi:hypothetical protein
MIIQLSVERNTCGPQTAKEIVGSLQLNGYFR